MGAEAPIFTRSPWSFRSFSWGDHSFTLISDLGLPISTLDLSPQRVLRTLCPQNARFSAPVISAGGKYAANFLPGHK